ncbi:stalk domain-containing protein [Paenibacillus aestuarii]|uniref:Stalk domain-containing protein n=1 Tax=Paenibacillus aestuarii TaxID=516965 RepID=A0ABW0K8R5_9BACL|nr:stalk domain-containing protein [Paenibacillus aestuarii]
MAKGAHIGLAVLVTSSSLWAYGVQAEAAVVKSLNMKEAADRGLQISAALRDAKTDIRKKNLELAQAQKAVKSEEAKASGLFAKPHNLSQDLNVKMKVPEARKQLYVAEQTLRQLTNSVRFDVQKAYLTAYQDADAEEAARKKADAAQAAVDTVLKKRKYGLADAAEQDKADQALEKARSDYKQAQITAKASRLALGKMTGLDMENAVQLSFDPDYADLSQMQLPAYIASAEKTTLSLLQAAEDRKLADEKLKTTRDLYSAKFGAGRMKVMDSMYKTQDIDMDAFMASYEETLARVKKDWEGYFLLLGFIPVPKSLLQGEYDGLRYLDDLANALPVATMDQNKALLQEKESRNAVISAVRQSYLEAKGAEEGYAQALRDKDLAVSNLDKANQKLKLSLIRSDELQPYQDALTQADRQIVSAQIGYKMALGKLDVDTGGAVVKTLKPGIIPYRELDDGLAAVKPQRQKAAKGSWMLTPAVGPLLSDFSVSINKKLGATEYTVLTKAGKPIGKRTKINKPLRNLTLKLSQAEELKIALYNKGTLLGVFPLEGNGSSGLIVDAGAEASAGGNGADGAAGADGTGDAGNAGGSGGSSGSGGSADGSNPGNGATDAEDKGLGTVLIGTYLVNLDALTPAAFQAASATMAESGQGILYKPDAPGAAWVDMNQVLDADALANPASSAVLTAEAAKSLKVTVEISAPGTIASKQTAEALQQQIDTLNKDIEKLEADKAAAVAAMKVSDIADLAVQLKDAQARLAMLQALQHGDSQAALKQMALVNNPDALIAALAGDEAGGGSAPPPDSAASAEQLAGQAELQQAKLEQAIAAGEPHATAAALQSLLATQAQLADAQTSASEGLASLQSAKQQLEAALAAAQHDPERAAELARSVAATSEALQSLHKDELFAQLDAAQDLLAALPADPVVQQPLEQQITKLLGELQQQEKAKYSAEELQALADMAAGLSASPEAGIQPVPVENVLSPNIFIKFDAPPVIINGQAYLPIRSVSESFGAAVDWDQDGLTVTVSTEFSTITSTIGQDTAYVDGEPTRIDGPSLLLAGRTYVPLRFIAESLGLQVDWHAGTQIIQISK